MPVLHHSCLKKVANSAAQQAVQDMSGLAQYVSFLLVNQQKTGSELSKLSTET